MSILKTHAVVPNDTFVVVFTILLPVLKLRVGALFSVTAEVDVSAGFPNVNVGLDVLSNVDSLDFVVWAEKENEEGLALLEVTDELKLKPDAAGFGKSVVEDAPKTNVGFDLGVEFSLIASSRLVLFSVAFDDTSDTSDKGLGEL